MVLDDDPAPAHDVDDGTNDINADDVFVVVDLSEPGDIATELWSNPGVKHTTYQQPE